MKHSFVGLIFLGGLTGCTMGPDYHETEPALSDHWQAKKKAAVGLQPVSPQDLKNWWKNFADARLDQLMEQALTGNLDLKIALTRIEQARAERRGTRG